MPPIKTAILRREKELQEFFLEKSWQNVRILSEEKVELDDSQGNHWIIQRSLNFHTGPPRVWKGGEEVHLELEWRPSFTTIEWLLLLMKQVESSVPLSR